MTSEVEQGIKLRVFVGCLVNSEVRMHLNFSDLWKTDQVIRSDDGDPLDKVRHEDKEYVGVTVSDPVLSEEELGMREAYVRRALERYCPELEVERFKMSVIPQLFLS